jgi:hypothetical protein
MTKPDEPRDADRSEEVRPFPDRRPYREPELIEYGSVAKLTQSGSMFGFDSMTRMTCL